MKRIIVGKNERYLSTDDGADFFWLGDTAWELVHIATREEADMYIKCRKKQGFNVIQTVALAENDGLNVPNAYGRLPLSDLENAVADDSGEYSYWAHLDYIIKTAEEHKMYVALLPTWGDKFNKMWGIGPVIFNPDNAYSYGKWIGNRYKDADNLVWVMGGDRPLDTKEHFDIVYAMARGIKESGAEQIMTFHPNGGKSSSFHIHNADWLDFNMIQTGHGSRELAADRLIKDDYKLLPVKPVLEGEPLYEDHPVGFKPENGYFGAGDVRNAVYRAVFSGSCGVTYGHHCVWNMTKKISDYFIMTWEDALERPAANQMKYLKNFFLELNFDDLKPAQNLLEKNYSGANLQTAVSMKNKVFVYTPNGLPISLNNAVSRGEWFNPRNGERIEIDAIDGIFSPPSSGAWEDWILCAELK